MMYDTKTALALEEGRGVGSSSSFKTGLLAQLTARAIAISLSVTVSIGLLMNGVLSTTLRVMRLSVETSCAAKSILPGRRRKSL